MATPMGDPYDSSFANNTRMRMRMNNPDPTNEFMYQIQMPPPFAWMTGPPGDNGKYEDHRHRQGESASDSDSDNSDSHRENEDGRQGDTHVHHNGNGQSSEIDLNDLNQRLRHLGLQQPDPAAFDRHTPLHKYHPHHAHPQDRDIPSPTSTKTPPQLYQHPHPPQLHPLASGFNSAQFRQQPLPPTTELRPQDSISMYRPVQHPHPHRRHHRAPSASSVRSGSRRRGGTNVDLGDMLDESGEDNGRGQDFEDDGYQDAGSYGTPGRETRRSPTFEQEQGQDVYYETMTRGPGSIWTGGTVAGNMYTMRDRLLNAAAAQDHAQTAEMARHIDDASHLAAALAKLETAEEQLRTLQATLIAERVARTQIQHRAEEESSSMRECRNELANAVRALRRAREEGKRTEEEKRRLQRSFEEAQKSLHVYNTALEVRKARDQGRVEGRDEAWAEASRWMGRSPPIPVDPVQSIPTAVLHQTPMPPQAQQLPPMQAQIYQQQPQPQQQQPQVPFSQPPHQQPNIQQAPQQIPHQPIYPPYMAPISQPNIPALGMTQPPFQPQPVMHPPQEAFQQGYPLQQQPQAQVPTVNAYNSNPQSGQARSQSALQAKQPSLPNPQTSHQGQPMVPANAQPPPLMQPNPQIATQTDMPSAQQLSKDAHRTPSQPSQRITPPSQQQGQRTPQRTQRSASVSHQNDMSRHETTAPASAADAYLDRVDHDPHLRQILSGAPSTAIHTSAIPPSEHSAMRDKPLPDPMAGAHRAPTTREPSRVRTANGNGRHKRSNTNTQRYSLMEGTHGQRTPAHVESGDRYPPFPRHGSGAGGNGNGTLSVNGHGHSRQSSFTAFDPSGVPLPLSVDHTAMQTPASTYHQHLSVRETPQSKVSRVRSRVAGALRNDLDLDQGELSNIEEERDDHHHPTVPPPAPAPASRQSAPYKSKGRYAPSMPPMRSRPIPVMPSLLGGGKAGSEPHTQQPRPSHANLQHMYGRDGAAKLTDRLPDPPANDQPANSHPLFIPPGLAPMAVGGDVEDVQGPRHSALGLEGLEGRSGVAGGSMEDRRVRGKSESMGTGTQRAPTVGPGSGPPPPVKNRNRQSWYA